MHQNHQKLIALQKIQLHYRGVLLVMMVELKYAVTLFNKRRHVVTMIGMMSMVPQYQQLHSQFLTSHLEKNIYSALLRSMMSVKVHLAEQVTRLRLRNNPTNQLWIWELYETSPSVPEKISASTYLISASRNLSQLGMLTML